MASDRFTEEHARIQEAAREMWEGGLSIFPLHHPDEDGDGKQPAIRAWRPYQARRCTQGEFKRWFVSNRRLHNIGVVCGPVSNILVVDIDSREAKIAVAEEGWDEPSRVVLTSKGEHWYYGWDPDFNVANRSKLDLDGVKMALDIRGAGGYVVGYGSRHESGHIYALDSSDSDGWQTIRTVPEDIAQRIHTPVAMQPKDFTARVEDSEQIDFLISHCASARTRLLLKNGAAEGERNELIFRAASDMNGLGIPEDVCVAMITAAPLDLSPRDAREMRRTIKSAYSKPSLPAVMYSLLSEDEVDKSLHAISAEARKAKAKEAMPTAPPVESEDEGGSDETEVTQADEPEAEVQERSPASDPPLSSDEDVEPVTPNDLRKANDAPPRISNVDMYERENAESGKVEKAYIAVPMQRIRDEIVEGLNGWPKTAGGALFAIKFDAAGRNGWSGKGFADHADVWWLNKPDDFFGWLHSVCDGVHWRTGTVRASIVDPSPISSVTKSEFFSRILQTPAERFDDIEIIPHFPQIDGVYYLVPQLPKVNPKLPLWNKWIQIFNPESDEDHKLIQAACLTPLWGGRAGTRPAFLISSKHGRGVGKTKTAEAIAAIYGGSIQAAQRTRGPSDFAKVLVDPSNMTRRCVVWDNLKGRQDYAVVETLITSPSIQEHRLYTGHVSRPNYITWFLTSNSPEASNDLAERCIPIEIGRHKHAVDFDSLYKGFLDKHRLGLIAEMMHIMEAAPSWKLDVTRADRWQAWARDVLCRVPGADATLNVIRERRREIDIDREDAAEVTDMVVSLVLESGLAGEAYRQGSFVFSTGDLYTLAKQEGLTQLSKISFGRWISRKISDGDLPDLHQYNGRSHTGRMIRGYVWKPPAKLMAALLGQDPPEDEEGDEEMFDQAKKEFGGGQETLLGAEED